MAFEFIADHPSLDFVATVAERGTTDLEGLRTPSDLARWLRESGVVDGPVPVSARNLRKAKETRDAVYRLIAAVIDGVNPAPADRAIVNAATAHARPRRELGRRGQVRRRGGVDEALAELATDVLDLVGGPDRELLHWCANERCTRPFVDRSRGRRRRWCGMASCGDKAKAATYRQRQRSNA